MTSLAESITVLSVPTWRNNTNEIRHDNNISLPLPSVAILLAIGSINCYV
jgi:hypothetical protein